ncbi:MAG: Na+/H+ antiporter subunit E [Treponema sp.]|nr:Na+/H+ antiporter subunit E [Treponema sp.]
MFFLYLLLWLIFSMRLSIGIVAAGIAISAAVFMFARVYLNYKIADDYKLIRKGFLVIQYVFILVWETAKGAVAVLLIAYGRTKNVRPCIKYFSIGLKTAPVLAVLANSITLMPGSVVIALEDGQFCIHCLDDSLVEGIEDSAPVRQLRKIERS